MKLGLAPLGCFPWAFFIYFRFSVKLNYFQKLFRRLKRTSLGFSKFEFRWYKVTMKCLGKNGLSDAVYSLSCLQKSRLNPVGQQEQTLHSANDFLLLGQRRQRKFQSQELLLLEVHPAVQNTALYRLPFLNLFQHVHPTLHTS